MNICKLSKPIPVYNVNSTPNKNIQISEVVDVVLQYQFYSEQALLIVLSTLDMLVFRTLISQFQVAATLSQYFLEPFYYNQVKGNTSAIFLYVQQFDQYLLRKTLILSQITISGIILLNQFQKLSLRCIFYQAD